MLRAQGSPRADSKKRWAESWPWLLETAQRFPRDIGIASHAARVAREVGEFEKALEITAIAELRLRDSLEESNDFQRLCEARAFAFYRLKRYEEAQLWFERAGRGGNDGNRLAARFMRAQALRVLERHSEAAKVLGDLVALGDRQSSALLGAVQADLGDFQSARANLVEWGRSPHSEVQRALGRVALDAGQFATALGHFLLVAARDPEASGLMREIETCVLRGASAGEAIDALSPLTDQLSAGSLAVLALFHALEGDEGKSSSILSDARRLDSKLDRDADSTLGPPPPGDGKERGTISAGSCSLTHEPTGTPADRSRRAGRGLRRRLERSGASLVHARFSMKDI